MTHITAKFYPAKEEHESYRGNADLFIGDAVRISGISVFKNPKSEGHHVQFPGYTDGKEFNSYIIPASKEAYAEMVNVIEAAMAEPEQHFAFNQSYDDPVLSVEGGVVKEPYADARFSLTIHDVCTIRGISTREAEHNGNKWVAVDMPKREAYMDENGEKVYPDAVECLVSEKEYEDKKYVTDYKAIVEHYVKGERAKAFEKERAKERAAEKEVSPSSLEDKVNSAAERAMAALCAEKSEPNKEPVRE